MAVLRTWIVSLLGVACAAGLVAAQQNGGRGAGGRRPVAGTGGLVYLNGDPYGVEPDGRLYSWPRRPTDLSDRHGVPTWEVDPHFKKDGFTFARVNYHSAKYSDSWLTDFPDSDLNLSFRLQELTAFKVNPDPVTVTFTDPRLFDYPFTYMVEVATLEFEEEEIAPLRRYLLNGGFLMVDDFWGEDAWNHFHAQMQRVFPDREPVELEISHPIFHYVFDLHEKPQIPGITFWAHHRDDGVTWEKPDAKGAHYWAYLDDKGRMITLICHNTDLGDGWSRELSVVKLLERGGSSTDDNDRYFHAFCEKYGYPMGVNILTYVMTH